MVQDKKNFSSGKKPMAQDLDKKSGAVADNSADAARTGSMKQTDLKDKSGIAGKRDVSSRK
ncbi:MAG: hypothetical protein H7336_04035 [Bacteriovorax sp.]|nr:hypothetical protein [Bacteriovorax sp.]